MAGRGNERVRLLIGTLTSEEFVSAGQHCWERECKRRDSPLVIGRRT